MILLTGVMKKHSDPDTECGTPKERSNWKTCAAGYGIHWPDLDEDLSTEGLLRGAPAPAGSARRPTNRPRRRRKARGA